MKKISQARKKYFSGEEFVAENMITLSDDAKNSVVTPERSFERSNSQQSKEA